MKTKRTIRTMSRAGMNPKYFGFFGITPPSGKRVRSIGKMDRAFKRLARLVPLSTLNKICATVPTLNGQIKAITAAAKVTA